MKEIKILEGEHQLLLENCPQHAFRPLANCKKCKFFIELMLFPAMEWKLKGAGKVFCSADDKEG